MTSQKITFTTEDPQIARAFNHMSANPDHGIQFRLDVETRHVTSWLCTKCATYWNKEM